MGRASGELTAEIEAAQTAWQAAFADDDPGAIVPLYDDDAALWGTLSPTFAVGRDAVRAYFEMAYRRLPGHTVAFDQRHVRIEGKTAISGGAYTFGYTQNGSPATLPARFTFVYRRRGGEWRIVHHHSSATPDPA